MSPLDTLDLWRRTTFVWGKSDCILSVADYILAATGKDPAAQWRGTYSDDMGALALAKAYGGVLGIMSYAAALAGFPPLAATVWGAPVVCDIAGKEIAGIWLGARGMFRTERGVIELRAPILGAWAI